MPRSGRALHALGYLVTTVRTTKQALAQIGARRFVAIISDMGRWEGLQEGYVLLAAVRERGLDTPFFFYAGSCEPEHVQLALERGANGCTNERQALYEMVRSAQTPAS